MLGCEELGKLLSHDFGCDFGCCGSCHDDINSGHYDEMIKITLNNKNYHVCCAALRALDDNEITYEEKDE